MTQIQQEGSPYTETRTQKSPQKLPFGMNLRSNYSAYSHNSNMQMEYVKLREDTKKQITAYLKQIELLKEELYRKNEEIEYFKSTIVMNLKKDLNDAQRDNIKNFKQSQRQAREIEKLRADNFNMQQDLQKQTKQRRSYLTKLDELKQIKETTKRQIIEKDKIIRSYAQQNKRLEKQVATFKLQIQDLIDEITDKQKRLMESESQYKAVLQKTFTIENQLKNVQRNSELMTNTYRDKINELEKERQELIERIQQQESRVVLSDRQSGGQLMIEVKSLMNQVYNLLDEKKHESKEIQKKFLASVACLEKTLPRR